MHSGLVRRNLVQIDESAGWDANTWKQQRIGTPDDEVPATLARATREAYHPRMKLASVCAVPMSRLQCFVRRAWEAARQRRLDHALTCVRYHSRRGRGLR